MPHCYECGEHFRSEELKRVKITVNAGRSSGTANVRFDKKFKYAGTTIVGGRTYHRNISVLLCKGCRTGLGIINLLKAVFGVVAIFFVFALFAQDKGDPPSHAPVANKPYSTISKDGVRLRAGPDIDAAIVGILSAGDKIQLLPDEKNKWCNVQSEKLGKGWVACSILQ